MSKRSRECEAGEQPARRDQSFLGEGKLKHFIGAVLTALLLTSCASNQDRQLTPADSREIDAYSEVRTLRIVYNSCKGHLTGFSSVAVCREITKIPGDNITTLALAILDNFKIANKGMDFPMKTSEGASYLAFMKLQSERFLRGDIGWNEMDYTITLKGDQMSKQIAR